MARVIVGMTTSLDGFVADESGSVDRLYRDLAALHGTAYMDAMIEETGAVLMGIKTPAMSQAAAAAGDKAVTVVGGASVSQQLLRAGLVDELHLAVIPVLVGAGRRMFEKTGLEHLKLERI